MLYENAAHESCISLRNYFQKIFLVAINYYQTLIIHIYIYIYIYILEKQELISDF